MPNSAWILQKRLFLSCTGTLLHVRGSWLVSQVSAKKVETSRPSDVCTGRMESVLMSRRVQELRALAQLPPLLGTLSGVRVSVRWLHMPSSTSLVWKRCPALAARGGWQPCTPPPMLSPLSCCRMREVTGAAH